MLDECDRTLGTAGHRAFHLATPPRLFCIVASCLSRTALDPILEHRRQNTEPIPTYEAGTWGPREANELIEREGRRWYSN